jgi:hypothetical protein
VGDDFHCGEPAGRTQIQVRGKKEMTRMNSEMMKRVVRSIEGEMDSKPSAFEFEMAYQARVAIDRIKFAIRQAEQFRLDSKEQHELSLQLLDALDRLEAVERTFQTRSRSGCDHETEAQRGNRE